MIKSKSTNIVWSETAIDKEKRNRLNKHRSTILWFTGLSGSGKSTVANALEQRLYKMGMRTYILDGDNVRHGLNRDLSFNDKDRQENIRRIGEVSKLFLDAGTIVLTAFISPFREDRRLVRQLVNTTEFIEVYIKCPIEVCEGRDVKGLYKKARQGEIKHFTGIDSPYEEPEDPELVIDTAKLSIEQSVDKILNYLAMHAYIEHASRGEKLATSIFDTLLHQQA